MRGKGMRPRQMLDPSARQDGNPRGSSHTLQRGRDLSAVRQGEDPNENDLSLPAALRGAVAACRCTARAVRPRPLPVLSGPSSSPASLRVRSALGPVPQGLVQSVCLAALPLLQSREEGAPELRHGDSAR
jgi:hypothetical protein